MVAISMLLINRLILSVYVILFLSYQYVDHTSLLLLNLSGEINCILSIILPACTKIFEIVSGDFRGIQHTCAVFGKVDHFDEKNCYAPLCLSSILSLNSNGNWLVIVCMS